MPKNFLYIWAYQVSPERHGEFVDLYGPDGSWVALFGRSPSYLGSQLLRDINEPNRFISIDRWESKHAFTTFRDAHADEFHRLDQFGEKLTTHEALLGEFEPAVPEE